MQKLLLMVGLLALVFVFQYCHTSKKIASKEPVAVSYEASIKPVIVANCSPCHIAGKGNKNALDNYATASALIDDILSRVQKAPGDRGFMPAMHSKLPDSTVQLFIQWKSSGLKEN